MACGKKIVYQGFKQRLFFFSKRSKRILSFSLAQRKEVKETSTLTKPLPIWRGCKLKIAEIAISRNGLVSRDDTIYYSFHLPSYFLLSVSSCSMISRLLLRRGTLCCPPSLPRSLSQSLKRFGRASIISRCCKVMFL